MRRLIFKDIARRKIYKQCINTNSICVELGVYRGWNAEIILEYNPQHLYLIDIWDAQKLPTICKNKHTMTLVDAQQYYQEVQEKFKQYSNVTIIKQTTELAISLFDNNSIDILYLDANHSKAEIDMFLWLPKIKTNGYLIGDDYKSTELEKKVPKYKRYTVKSGIKKLLNQHLVSVINIDPETQQYCLQKI